MAILAGQRIRALDFAGYAHAADPSNISGLGTVTGDVYQTPSPVLGVAFMAPSSGAVTVTTYARFQSNGSTITRAYAACQLRTGAIIESGVLVAEPDVDQGAIVVSDVSRDGGASALRVHTDLTPGALYHFVFRSARAGSTAGTYSINARTITVQPWHG